MEILDYIINGGETKRFHTWPMLREQRVDAHSFHVAMLCALIAQDADPAEGEGLTVPLLMAALVHDLPEHKTGDLPAPAKRNPDVVSRDAWNEMEEQSLRKVGLDWEHALGPKQRRWLKMADAMQGALHCIRERQMGNKLIATVFTNFRSYIRELDAGDSEEAMIIAIIQYIDDMWEQANG